MRALPKPECIALWRVSALLSVTKAPLAWVIVAGIATLVCAVGLAMISAWLIAHASQTPPVASLALAATIVRAFGASCPVLRYPRRLTSHSMAFRGMPNLRPAVYPRLIDSRIDRVTRIRRDDLSARTGGDIDVVGDLVVCALPPITVAVFASAAGVTVAVFFSPTVVLILAYCLTIAGPVDLCASMRGARLAEIQQVEDRAELVTLSLTMFESSDELRIFGRVDVFVSVLDDAEQKIFANRDVTARSGAPSSAIETLAARYTALAALVVGGGEMAGGALTPVRLTIIALVPLTVFEAVGPLGEAAVQLVRPATASKRILDLLDGVQTGDSSESIPADSDASADFMKLSATAYRTTGSLATSSPAETEPVAKSLVTKGPVIGWPGGPELSTPIDLAAGRGSSFAVVELSGAGKTTLLYTPAGMLESKTGSVLLDDRPVHLIPRAEVSTFLTPTAENAHLFGTSIPEDLRAARRDVSEEEATELLIRVGLGPWLAGLPDGVHTALDTDTTMISDGGCRRLLLARTLASPTDCLLIDGSIEHLGGETADALIRDLVSTEGKTVVLVSYRLTAFEGADSVAILDRVDDRTRVLAQGAHDELAASLPAYRWSLSRGENR